MERVAFLLLLLLALPGRSQQLAFFKPENLNKLPSSECYNIMQDSRGYIWFSTEAGLCRYNGNTVKVYGKQQGLPEEATYQVFEDPQRQLWMVTARNRILRYNLEKDSLEEAFFSKNFTSGIKNGLEQVYFTQIEGDSVFWLPTQNATYKVNIRTGICTLVPGDSTDYTFVRRGGQLIHLKTKFPISRSALIVKEKFTTLSIRSGEQVKTLKITREKDRLPVWRLLTVTNKKGISFVAYDNVLIKIDAELGYEVFRSDATMLGLYLDKDDGLWLSRSKGGVVYYPNSVIADSLKITALTDLSATTIWEDREGGIWCTTLEKGVFYSKSKKIVNFSNIPGLDKKVELLKAEGGRLFASSEKNELIWTRGNIFHKTGFPHSINYGLSDILSYGNNWLVSGKREILLTDASFKQVGLIKSDAHVTAGLNQFARQGTKIFGVLFGALLEITKNPSPLRIRALQNPGRCILLSRKNELFIGGKSGLVKVDTSTFAEKKTEGIQGGIAKIAEDEAGVLWIATRDNGLYLLSGGKVEKISESLNFPTARISDIIFDRFGTAWLATHVGVLRIRNKAGKRYLAVLNTSNGLLSEEVNAVAVFNDMLYVSTQEGVCTLPVESELINNTPPPIYISSISVNDSLVDLKDGAELPYRENNLKVLADVLTFKQPFEPPRMFYLLSGLDNKSMHVVEGREWAVNNLAPGYYTLFLDALNNDGEPSAKPIKISFTILKPFWQQPLFIIGSFLLAFSLIAPVVTLLLKRVRKKEEEKTRINTLIAQYHMSALRAQMNPHFIFNCINSIQRFVITNRPEEAYEYLAKFSKLIRLVLNYAEENFISLEQELEVIRLYLALEQMRVESKFTWSIECPEGVHMNQLEVPVMMLQPYVENAIWHGVMNLGKEKRGHIAVKIGLLLKDQLLQVTVEDNGIGREKAAQLAARNHRSKATGINQKRSEMMNILSGSSSGRIEIEDLVDATHSPAGTRVKIFISQKTETHEYS